MSVVGWTVAPAADLSLASSSNGKRNHLFQQVCASAGTRRRGDPKNSTVSSPGLVVSPIGYVQEDSVPGATTNPDASGESFSGVRHMVEREAAEAASLRTCPKSASAENG